MYEKKHRSIEQKIWLNLRVSILFYLDSYNPIMWLLVPICGVKKFKLYLKDMFKISEKCKYFFFKNFKILLISPYLLLFFHKKNVKKMR